MKQLILLCIGFTFTVSLQAQWFGSSGDIMKEDRKIGSFDGIIAKGAVNVYVSFGSSEELTIEVDKKYQDQLITEVRGNDLYAYTEGKIWNPKKLDVYVTAKNLKYVKASGASDVIIEDNWEADRIRIELSGSSDLEANRGIECESFRATISASSDLKMYIETGDLTATLSGSSDIKAEGTATEVDIVSRGSSDFKGNGLKVKSAKLEATGSSDIRLYVSDELSAEASGSSDIVIDGRPRINYQKATGSASISAY